MNGFLEFIFNFIGALSLLFYVSFRIKKIYDDYHNNHSFAVRYYLPTAIACILIFIYGIVFTLWPIIISSSLEFIISFIVLIYYSCKMRGNLPV